jgi:predicted AAA+ superfamily ATPase
MKINREQLVQVIGFWQKTLGRGTLRPRRLLKMIDTRGKEVIDLVGPRRSGKSSILKLLVARLGISADEFLYINFEDPFFVEHHQVGVIEEIISVFGEHFSPRLKYLFFDEVQEISHWEKAIRKLRDGEEFKIFLTGSSSKLLSRELSSLLTGRHKTYKVFPLSFAEFLDFRGLITIKRKDIILQEEKIKKLFGEFLLSGGFPEPVLNGDAELLKNYFFDILQKDIVARYEVREREILERIAVFVLSNVGKTVSMHSLGSIHEVSRFVAARYVRYLEEAFLIFGVSQFSHSLKRQQKALRKLYAIDTGLANAVSFRFSEDKGRYLENTVLLELLRMNRNIFYYKTRKNTEVDFCVFEQQKIQQLIQVSWSLTDEKTAKRERESLLQAMEETGLSCGTILTYEEEDTLKFDDKTVTVMPVWKWLLESEVELAR